MSIKNNFPTAKPAIVLDFANSKKLDSRVYFHRNSRGTYVGPNGYVETAAEYEARFDHDPITGESYGLLIESSVQNLINNNISYGTWSLGGANIALNSGLSPDGKNNAVKFTENTPNSDQHLLFQAIPGTINIGNKYTISIWAKSAERNTIGLTAHGESYQWFNLSTGTAYTTPAGMSNATITPYKNGWYRCSVTITRSATQPNFYFVLSDSSFGPNNVYSGTVGSGIYVWGAQVEAGEYLSSWIPVPTSTYATRGHDTAALLDSAFDSVYNLEESTIVCSWRFNQLRSNYQKPVAIYNNGGEHYGMGTRLLNLENPDGIFYIGQNGFIDIGIGYQKIYKNRLYKAALAVQLGTKIYGTFDGKPVVTLTTAKDCNPHQMSIGNTLTGAEYLDGTLDKIIYYPVALTEKQLINLTKT